MKILNFFYENPPQHKEIHTRKVALNAKNTLIKGAKFSGKKSLILDFLGGFESKDFLFLDFEDLRFNATCLQNLAKFSKEKALKIIVFYAVARDFNFDFKGLKHAQIIVATEFASLNLAKFREITLDFLDFEEFISLAKMPTNSQLGAFLQTGRSFAANLNEYLRANFSGLEREILGFVAQNLGEEFSANELYLQLKKSLKTSKDSLYSTVAGLENRGILRFLPHENKRLKKAYFRDFALRNALNIDKNFKQVFANLVFTELFKAKSEICYNKHFDFYLKSARNAVIPSPTLDLDLLKIKARKILPHALEQGVSKLVFITLSTEFSFKEKGVKIEILPFEEWALSL